MSKGSGNIQAFQVLEPEKKAAGEYVGPNYEGRLDPRLLTFCITNFVLNVGVSQIAPFYPDLAAKEAGLNYTEIGIVFGINPVGSIGFSLIIGTMISVWGRRRCLVGSLMAQCVVQVLFGCLNYMTGNKDLFFIMSMFTRICQGASRSVYSTVTFAYIPLFWQSEFQKKLAIMETMTALGLLFGPMIGSVLNSMLGFSPPFFMIGTFFLLAIIPILMLLPSDKELKAFQKKKKLPLGKAFRDVKVRRLPHLGRGHHHQHHDHHVRVPLLQPLLRQPHGRLRVQQERRRLHHDHPILLLHRQRQHRAAAPEASQEELPHVLRAAHLLRRQHARSTLLWGQRRHRAGRAGTHARRLRVGLLSPAQHPTTHRVSHSSHQRPHHEGRHLRHGCRALHAFARTGQPHRATRGWQHLRRAGRQRRCLPLPRRGEEGLLLGTADLGLHPALRGRHLLLLR